MLINNALEMSTIESGRVALVEHPFNLVATLDEVAQMFAAEAASNATELRIEPVSGLDPSLLGDGGKVKQILINLVSNAVKFTRQGFIRVSATSSALADDVALVEIVVGDTGTGIAEQDLTRMFQPFEQLAAGARAGGTGLGLAISLAYARLMGGDISVESAPGAGSRFKLTFTAKRGSRRGRGSFPDRLSSVASIAPTQSKVLVVDDVDVIRDVVAALLEKNAFETRTAADGLAALSIHSEWRPDVVLMDLRMPGMNGIEVIRRLRDAGSTAVIGVLTAGAFGDDEREALRAGADFFMRKPFNDRELLDGLARVVAARSATEPGRGGAAQGAARANRPDVGLDLTSTLPRRLATPPTTARSMHHQRGEGRLITGRSRLHSRLGGVSRQTIPGLHGSRRPRLRSRADCRRRCIPKESGVQERGCGDARASLAAAGFGGAARRPRPVTAREVRRRALLAQELPVRDA